MKRWEKQIGFTIVELLIVIVLIAIIASVTLVGYGGVQQRAREVALQADLDQAADKVFIHATANGGDYPSLLSDIGVSDADKTTYQYTFNNSSTPKVFCLTATYQRTTSYYVSSATGSTKKPGICPGHNTIVWYESVAGANIPIPSGAVDTAVYRSGDRSIRLGTGQVGRAILTSPATVVEGQQYTVSLWIRTDSTWNGTAGNSKIRFGNQSNGAFLTACGYNGVKLAWTFVTCSYTVPAGITSITYTVGNDGTVGNIWIDDVSVSIVGP